MPNLISRLYNFVNDANNGVPITALRVDSELNQLVNTQNQAAIVAATAPSSPINGELWIDSTNKVLKQYRNSEWVLMGPVHFGTTAMATPQTGDIWLDTSGSEVILRFRNLANSAWIQISDANLWATPPALGGTTPNTGAFSTLKVGTTHQGDILYDNGTTIVRLTPGTSGQVLQTQGASANPQWGFPSGQLGAWNAAFSANTQYTATTDGFVLAYMTNTTGNDFIKAQTPDGTTRTWGTPCNTASTTNVQYSVFMPVRKGDTWRIATSGGSSINIFFIPLGS